jgi:S1-C subfamily serine protease
MLNMQVIPGSPASRAGVHNDDVIVEFDGVTVTTINQVFEFPLKLFLVISHYSA